MNLRILLLIAVLFGCQSNKNKLDLNFKVKGLKKGKITLKKLNDSSYSKIDSFTVKGNEIIKETIFNGQDDVITDEPEEEETPTKR